MPERPISNAELILRLALQKSEQARLSSLADEQKRLKKNQQAYFVGVDADTGKSLMQSQGAQGSIAVRAQGNTNPALGQTGRNGAGGVDHGRVRGLEIEVYSNPSGPRYVKILARKYSFDTGKYQLYLGGDRKTPLLILDNIPSYPLAYLDLTGNGKDDWIVGYSYAGNGLHTIGVIKGNGDGWEITDPATGFCQYKGYGFFGTNTIYAYDPEAYSVENQASPFPLGFEVGELGSTIFTNYHSFSDRFYYHENWNFVGPRDVTKSGVSQSYEFNQLAGGLKKLDPNISYDYTGTNTRFETRTLRGLYSGAVVGPGYIPLLGDTCNLNGEDTGIRAFCSNAKYQQWAGTTIVRTLDTQSYSFSAQNGAIQPSIGSHTINGNNVTLESSEVTRGQTSSGSYAVRCQSFGSYGAAHLVYALEDGPDDYPYEPPTGSRQNQTVTAFSNTVKISPSLQKTNVFDVTETYHYFNNTGNSRDTIISEDHSGRALYYNGGVNIENGYVYNSSEITGQATFHTQYGSTPFPQFYSNVINTNKSFLNWKGNDYELATASIFSTSFISWIDSGEDPYPNGLLANLANESSSDLFRINKDHVFNIDLLKGSIVNGKLAFASGQSSKAKAYSLTSLGSNSTSVADIKYRNV